MKFGTARKHVRTDVFLGGQIHSISQEGGPRLSLKFLAPPAYAHRL